MDFRTRFMNFMRGRNGMDDLARFESVLTLILILLSWISRIFSILALIGIFHMYFRVFSKNIAKRQQENQRYCQMRYKFFVWKDKQKKRFEQRKIYRFYKCPMCKQQVRVPKGHGRISITCPKCREEFVRKS